MPMQSHVKIIEQALTSHVDLGSFGLLGSAPIQTNGAWNALLSYQIFQCDCRSDTPCSKKIVTTAVTAGDLIFTGLLIWHGFVPESRQSIIFSQNTKNGCPRAKLRNECSWYARRSPARNSESLFLQNIHN